MQLILTVTTIFCCAR